MRAREIQTMIDECADGTWQGTLLVGSTRETPWVDGATFREVAELLAAQIDEMRRPAA